MAGGSRAWICYFVGGACQVCGVNQAHAGWRGTIKRWPNDYNDLTSGPEFYYKRYLRSELAVDRPAHQPSIWSAGTQLCDGDIHSSYKLKKSDPSGIELNVAFGHCR